MLIYAKKGVKFYQKWDIPLSILPADLPEFLKIPLCVSVAEEMRFTAPAGSRVTAGEALAVPVKEGCPVYAPVSGTVTGTELCKIPGLGQVPCALLRPDPGAALPESCPVRELSEVRPEDLIEIARRAAIVDETDGKRLYRKLEEAAAASLSAVTADGVDDQPFCASESAVLLSYTKEVADGLLLIGKFLGTENCCIAARKNVLTFSVFREPPAGMQMAEVRGKYPAAPAVRKFSENRGALTVGVQACRALYLAAVCDLPQLSSAVTVWGEGVSRPAVMEVPFGTPAAALLHQCGAAEVLERVVAGGVMTGGSVAAETPVSPAHTALTALVPGKEYPIEPCTGCGRCIASCPQGLSPSHICQAAKRGDLVRLEWLKTEECLQCGCCSYICPARIPLSGVVKSVRKALREKQREEQSHAKSS